MRKILPLLAAAIFTSVTGWSQVTPPHIVYGSSEDTGCSLTSKFFYSYYFVGPTSQYRLEHAYGNGRKDTTSLASGQTTTLHVTYGTPGIYSSKAVLLQNNLRVDSMVQVDTVGDCILFDGLFYADQNANCVFNDGVDPVIARPYRIRVDSANIPIDTVYGYGTWRYFKKGLPYPATQYRFTVLNPSPLLVSTCQTANAITVNHPLSPTSNLNFGYSCPGGNFDLTGSHIGSLRNSNAGGSWINGKFLNDGCMAQAFTATYKLSPKYSVISVYPTPTSVSNNLITWNLPALQPTSQQNFFISVSANGVHTIGDTAQSILTMGPTTGDASPSNNIIIRNDTIRGPLDPNDKSVLPAGNIASSTTLTYHINFENLGNDTAFNVYILDTLSANLDASSFALLSASHVVRSSLIQGAGGIKLMKFEFPNIRLGHAAQPAQNKGYVRFTMRAKSGLAAGTQIPNRAGIYFDYNPVVMTNTAMSTIGTPQSVNLLQAAPVNTVHPNPTSDRVTITNADGSLLHATLMSTTGQVVQRSPLTAGENTLSIEALPAGIYFLQLQGTAGTQVEKLEKR